MTSKSTSTITSSIVICTVAASIAVTMMALQLNEVAFIDRQFKSRNKVEVVSIHDFCRDEVFKTLNGRNLEELPQADFFNVNWLANAEVVQGVSLPSSIPRHGPVTLLSIIPYKKSQYALWFDIKGTNDPNYAIEVVASLINGGKVADKRLTIDRVFASEVESSW